MTVTLDISPRLFSKVEADATAQNRPVADLLLDAVADRWDDEADDLNPLPADIYKTHPLPASLTQPLGEMLRKSYEASDEGRVIDGETFLAEMRRLAGRA